MYNITIPSIPFPQESYKDKSPHRTSVWGAAVAKCGLIRSLFQHSQCDTFYILCESQREFNKAGRRLAWYPNQERVQPILLDDYHRLKGHDRMVLFHPGSSGADGIRDPALQGLVNLRAFKGRACWPITGVTHSISGPPGFWFVFEALLEALHSHDSLVCTSEAGRKAILQIISSMTDAAVRKYGRCVSPTVQLPVIPLGTDAEAYQPRDKAAARERAGLPQESVIFLYLGRFSTHYKVDLFPLVLAFSRLDLKVRAKATLILAGDDVQHRLSPRLEAFAADLGVTDRVLVLPNPTGEYKTCLYNAADVFVSPSDSVQETFGQTIIEAMASGLPVIASDWDGHRDTVKHGTTGFLVPTYWADCFDHLRRTPFLRGTIDLYKQLGQATSVDMKALSAYMEQLIDNGSLRRTMGEAARRRVLESYNWPVVIEQYEALWLELMDQAAKNQIERECDDFSFDYLDTFRYHPTNLITTDCWVKVSALGAKLADDASRFEVFRQTELCGKAEISSRIVAEFGPEERVPVTELIRRLSREAPALQIAHFQQLAQLIKYGILELC